MCLPHDTTAYLQQAFSHARKQRIYELHTLPQLSSCLAAGLPCPVLSFNPLNCSSFRVILPSTQGSPFTWNGWSASSFLPQGSHMHSVWPFLFQREADKPQETPCPLSSTSLSGGHPGELQIPYDSLLPGCRCSAELLRMCVCFPKTNWSSQVSSDSQQTQQNLLASLLEIWLLKVRVLSSSRAGSGRASRVNLASLSAGEHYSPRITQTYDANSVKAHHTQGHRGPQRRGCFVEWCFSNLLTMKCLSVLEKYTKNS